MEELIKRLEKMEKCKHNHAYGVEDVITPLTPRVEDTPFPRKFKTPSLDTYDGTEDPFDHLMSYKYVIKLHSVMDAGLCNMFLSTLKGSAMMWYQGLRKRSIHSLKQLSTTFLRHFSSKRVRQKSSTIILNVQQKELETLREYNTRFNNEEMTLQALYNMVAVTAFVNGVINENAL